MEYLQIVCKQFVWWEDSFWLILACYETQFYSNNSVFWTESDLRGRPEDSFFNVHQFLERFFSSGEIFQKISCRALLVRNPLLEIFQKISGTYLKKKHWWTLSIAVLLPGSFRAQNPVPTNCRFGHGGFRLSDQRAQSML